MERLIPRDFSISNIFIAPTTCEILQDYRIQERSGIPINFLIAEFPVKEPS